MKFKVFKNTCTYSGRKVVAGRKMAIEIISNEGPIWTADSVLILLA